MEHPLLLKLAVKAAFEAGQEILKIYNTDFYVETKPDHTPVTLADKAASKRIISVLEEAGFPIISEEEVISNYPVRRHWEFYWLVDPLDGTKEFIKRNGEFAVNIALIHRNRPVIGVIYGPFFKSLYFGRSGQGSFKVELDDIQHESDSPSWFDTIESSARRLPLQRPPKNYTVIASRSHLSREINGHIERLENMYGQVDMINAGSSIKQCWVAEGLAHEYPRFGTTMEWDTAAGQCILEEAGKQLIDLSTNEPMRYNKEALENNFFIAKT